MRFTFAEAMTDPSFYAPLAQAAEKAGYAGFTIPDSLAYPEESDATYPYTPDGNREFLVHLRPRAVGGDGGTETGNPTEYLEAVNRLAGAT